MSNSPKNVPQYTYLRLAYKPVAPARMGVKPLYTTKSDGQGIGLLFCRNIVEKHGGKLSLEARKENGAKAITQLVI